MKQGHKVVWEKEICPKFCKCADLKCQATVMSVIYHDQMDNMEH